MAYKESGNNNGGGGSSLGFTSVLTIVFITLKLCHVIDWPWLWVFSPLLINILIVAIFILVVILFLRRK